MAEEIKINVKDANDYVYGEYDEDGDYTVVHIENYPEHGRWESYHTIIIKRKSDGKLFGADYSMGLTEMQEKNPFESYDADKDDNIIFKEVEPVEVKIIEYHYVN